MWVGSLWFGSFPMNLLAVEAPSSWKTLQSHSFSCWFWLPSFVRMNVCLWPGQMSPTVRNLSSFKLIPTDDQHLSRLNVSVICIHQGWGKWNLPDLVGTAVPSTPQHWLCWLGLMWLQSNRNIWRTTFCLPLVYTDLIQQIVSPHREKLHRYKYFCFGNMGDCSGTNSAGDNCQPNTLSFLHFIQPLT